MIINDFVLKTHFKFVIIRNVSIIIVMLDNYLIY